MKNSLHKLIVALMMTLTTIAMSSQSVAADETGKQIFDHWCSHCHADTPIAPATVHLTRKKGKAYGAIEKSGLPKDYIQVIVRSGLGAMPPFRRVELSDAQVEAVADYLAKTQ